MEKYQQIKNRLDAEGVSMTGFSSWLKLRQMLEEQGLGDMYNQQKSLGLSAEEAKWEKAYSSLKKEVNVEEFANWLVDFPYYSDGFDVFTCIGRGVTKLGRLLMSKD